MGFYTVKFGPGEHQRRALREGSWFVAGAFLSVRIWEPNFVPSDSKIQSTVLWIRLSSLPMKYYDSSILGCIGQKIERLVKVDACTSATLGGQFARICV